MARTPRDPAEAAEALELGEKSTVALVGPDHGFIAAVAEVVGDEGTVVVQSPPPDDATDGAKIVDALADDLSADAVVAWVNVVGVHAVRDLGARVADGGSLWLVLPKTDRESRAPVTEGELKRTMLAAGWREERVVPLSATSYALRFRKRR